MTRKKNSNVLDKRAISPAISSVILTGTIIALLSSALVFANNYLWAEIAEGEFTAAQQFMQTLSREIDDVAWTAGRTETIHYSSRFGDVYFLPSALNYTVYAQTNGSYQLLAYREVGVLLFNIPTSKFTMSDDYYKLLSPPQSSSLILKGSAAPVARVFAVEKLFMGDGDYIRVVVAPSLRFLNSTITMSGVSTAYTKLFLPVLTAGDAPRITQAVTLRGNGVEASVMDGISSIYVSVSFIDEASQLGFNASFYNFPSLFEEIDVPENSVLEFYTGQVTVEFGIDD